MAMLYRNLCYSKTCYNEVELYNQCFEDAGHVFICPMGLQFYLMQVNKIGFVETGKKCRIIYFWCAGKPWLHRA